jgi:sterol desaturase/sphingolipid hydroxylase (fatty acid hydroxylase superfamily)
MVHFADGLSFTPKPLVARLRSAMNPPLQHAIGQRAGVAAGLLGMLCVLGALCFLLPELLVAKDALPLYAAHIGVLRALLHFSIVLTFALAALALLLRPGSRHGLAGLLLGVVSLLLGGSQAEPLDIGGARAWSAGLDYFVLELLVLGLLFIPLEGLFALHVQRVFRPGWQTDLKHFFVSHAGVQLLSFAGMVPAQVLLTGLVQLDFQRAVAAQPLWLQFIQLLVTVDFATYWVHRAFHHWPALWRFHAIHHSSLHMDWLAGSRMHVVDVVATRAVAFVPVFVLGFAPAALYAYLVFVSFHAVFIHANVRWRFMSLRWLISTPAFHHWHHASDEEGIDKNFAAFLPLWDLLFGTAHLPGHWPKRYGTVEFQPPEGYLGQLAYPFRRRARNTPYG